MELFVQILEVTVNASAVGLACLFIGWNRASVDALAPVVRNAVWSIVYIILVVLVMLVPVAPAGFPGLFIDLRGAVIVLAILFGGVVPGLLTVLAAVLLRYAVGGSYALVGSMSVVAIFVVAILLLWLTRVKAGEINLRQLLVLALGVGLMAPAVPTALLTPGVFLDPLGWYVLIQSTAIFAGVGAFVPVVIKADRARRFRDALTAQERELSEKNRELQDLAARLKRTQTAMRSVMDHTVDGLIPLDGEGRILNLSRPAERMFGYRTGDVREAPLTRLMSMSDKDFAALLTPAEDETVSREVLGRRKDGSEFPMDLVIGRMAGVERARFLATVRDISERKFTEAQLMQARKMEAVGHLARGFAHDFNNILAAIMGFANLLNEDLPDGTPQSTFARRILAAGQRATGLVQQIMTFSRTVEVERQASDLGELVKEVGRVFRTTLPENVRLEMDVEDHEHRAFINQAQTIQIMNNLCINARDAIGSEGGEIVVSLSHAGQDDPLVDRIRGMLNAGKDRLVLRPGCAAWGKPDPAVLHYLKLSVRDTGPGVTDALMESMFDPFFSTKEGGEGTGLGLAFVHAAVCEQNGMGLVESAPGKGTAFTIFLPEAGEEANARAHLGEALPGRERVMIVDDETDITDALTLSLSKLGYEVLAVNTARDAIAVLEADPAAWDIVTSDLTMPGLSGMQLFHKLRALGSPARFILCSGYFDGEVEEEASAAGVDALIAKPVGAVALTGVIRQLMDATRGS